MRKVVRNWLIALVAVIIILIVALGIGGYIFYQGPPCEDEACFQENLANCKRSTFVADRPETILKYRILSVSEGDCRVNVELLQIKRGATELVGLEGESMICNVPLNTFIKPEEDIKNCHGILKEEIQEALIQRMHSQLIENIGQINLETQIL